jgi:hypothetical protein
MKVKHLSETNFYYGELNLPKDYEINKKELIHDMIFSKEVEKNLYENTEQDYYIEYSQDLYKIYDYIKDHFQLKLIKNINNSKIYSFSKEIEWCNVLYPNENYFSRGIVNPVDLKHSPDYTVIYALKTSPCNLTVYYDDNRRAGRSYKIDVRENEFYIFPSCLHYSITDNKSDQINYFYCMGFTYA